MQIVMAAIDHTVVIIKKQEILTITIIQYLLKHNLIAIHFNDNLIHMFK